MPKWIHLSLAFKNYQQTIDLLSQDAWQAQPNSIYKELISYLIKIVDALERSFIKRYFFLFEPDPHLFLALELINDNQVDIVIEKILQVAKPDFIESAKIDKNTRDENNGEVALNYFCAGTKFAFFRMYDNYKYGYNNNDESKLVHCFCNQLFVNHENEINFYYRCLQHRGVVRQL